MKKAGSIATMESSLFLRARNSEEALFHIFYYSDSDFHKM
jgi:hypothetical protein